MHDIAVGQRRLRLDVRPATLLRSVPLVPLAAMLCIILVASGAIRANAARASQPRAAETAYLHTVTKLTASDVTSNLRGVVGKRVAFVCEIVSIVDRATMIGQCGKDIEPIDIYVHMVTSGVHANDRVRVIGEMETPSVWVDVTGHPWYTAFLKALYVDRI